VNLKITIKEWEGGVVFLRKVVPGTSDRSYGIHAARVAGLPALVLRRAEDILKSLELRRDLLRQGVRLDEPPGGQFSLFRAPDPEPRGETVTDRIRDLIDGFDVDASTPLEALQLVKRVQDELRKA